MIHIQPGKPTQNGHVESFHGRFRDECLNASWFWNLWDGRRKIAGWRNEYNGQRPHSALGYGTPQEFAQQWAHAASPSSISRYHSAGSESRPSPSGASGGLDTATAAWSNLPSRRRCG
ncbi:MAG: transposase [Acidobacteriaceae bacterium]|nr:transposase [Acidobacteriaceae bacterium]